MSVCTCIESDIQYVRIGCTLLSECIDWVKTVLCEV